jgi:hypothetical protein
VLFCSSLLCPIGAPSYTELRKDCASDVVCVIVIAVAGKWRLALSSTS